MFEKAVVPRIFSLYGSGRREEGRKLLASFFAVSLFVGGALLTLLYLTYPFLCRLLGPGVAPEDLPIFYGLTRQLIPFALIIGLSAILGSFLLFGGMTFIYGVSSSFLNIGIISAVLFFGGSLLSLPVGVLLGGSLIVLFQLPFFIRVVRELEAGKFRGFLRKNESFLKQVVLVSIYSVALKSAEVVDKAVGNLCGEGVVSALNFGFRLVSFPLAIFGLAISRSVMRFLTESSSEKEMVRWTERGLDLACTLIPAVSVFCLLFSREIVAVIFLRGRFDLHSLAVVSAIFGIYSVGLLPQTLLHVLSRFYSVMERNTIPAAVSSLVAAVNVLLDLLLYRKLGYIGIALATSIAHFVGAGVLSLHSLLKHGLNLKRRFTHVLLSLLSALPSTYLSLRLTQHLVEQYSAKLIIGGGVFASLWLVTFSLLSLTKWKRYDYLMCGGGTGGHVFPLVAVSNVLEGEHLYI
jgi:putative peptidoglycan lipid II flippase